MHNSVKYHNKQPNLHYNCKLTKNHISHGQCDDCPVCRQPVDWSWNHHADRKFQFMDHALVALVRSRKDKDATEFFKLLSLCHTVMVEHKDGNAAGSS